MSATEAAEVGLAAPATETIPSPRGPSAGARGRLRRAVDLMVAHPVLTAAAVAMLVRIAMALGIVIVTDDVAIPDEIQYIELATSVADGRGVNGWQPPYGGELFSSTGAFTAPLSGLFWLVGTSRFAGQLLAAV